MSWKLKTLQKYDRGQIFRRSSQTCTRVGCFVGWLRPCSGSHIYRHIYLMNHHETHQTNSMTPWDSLDVAIDTLGPHEDTLDPFGHLNISFDPIRSLRSRSIVPYKSSDDPSNVAVDLTGYLRRNPWPTETPDPLKHSWRANNWECCIGIADFCTVYPRSSFFFRLPPLAELACVCWTHNTTSVK